MRRPPAQAARLRDPDRQPRAAKSAAICSCAARFMPMPMPGAQEDHRRRDREDAADAEHQPRTKSPNARSISPRARIAASTRSARRTTTRWPASGATAKWPCPATLRRAEVVEGMPEGGKIHSSPAYPRPSRRTMRPRKCSRSPPNSTRPRDSPSAKSGVTSIALLSPHRRGRSSSRAPR